MKNIKRVCAALMAAAILFIVVGFIDTLEVKTYTVEDEKIPSQFDGYTIVQLSDFHNHPFGENQEKLIAAIQEANADLILLTGDMINRNEKQCDHLEKLLEGIAKTAPIYAVAGNHELDNPWFPQELLKVYEQYGVEYLDGQSVEISLGGESIFLYAPPIITDEAGIYWVDNEMTAQNPQSFNMAMSHFGNFFDYLVPCGYDLIFSGHTHGGIVRLPFIGGIIGNEKELFPGYDSGVFVRENTTMILSAGLGDASFPRFYNRRQLVVVTLKSIGLIE